jgi:hypothetical protein
MYSLNVEKTYGPNVVFWTLWYKLRVLMLRLKQ